MGLGGSHIVLLALTIGAVAAGAAPTSETHSPTAGDSFPVRFLSLGERALFFAVPSSEYKLFSSEGTVAGTQQLTDAALGNYLGSGGGLAYLLEPGPNGSKLWRTDGTHQGTRRLVEDDLRTYSRPTPISFVMPGSRRLFLEVLEGPASGVGVALWTSDGESAGTRRIAFFPEGQLHRFTAFRNKVFFAAYDSDGWGLWSSDGQPEGTRLVLRSPIGHSSPHELRVSGDRLFFFTYSAEGPFLWKTDGTPAGTQRLLKVGSATPFTQVIDSVGHAGLNRLFFFTQNPGPTPATLWVSDGTKAGTRRLVDKRCPVVGGHRPLSANDHPKSVLLFGARDPAHGFELWSTKGTVQTTNLLKDFCPGACDGQPFFRVGLKGRIYFVAETPSTGHELWSTNGTPAGTRLLKEICPGPCDGTGLELIPIGFAGGRMYFQRTPTRLIADMQLWSTDGTPAGTRKAADVLTRETGAAAGNVLLMNGFDPETGEELWRSDGTPQGTGMLLDIKP